ncbi:LysR family transcriptional regulator [Achromobacter spanius]|uniref:LysR family transcriptional regulator n=1 Tax=Achromobacter spanius TaxID=217203 RepID=A0A2S0I9L7_9BURK|nr:LysR family transcriptional regulator [Achromobacter spanius]AVJ28735.1 LysR family transcriptional regulator [Achromobacter spanius]
MLTHRHIEVFRAVMIAGSVTKAADLLNTSQPTVSRELARMEQTIGFALFERIAGRLRPTMPALALFEEVRQSYAGLERVASAAARLRAFREGQLSVITLPAFSHSILPDAFRCFHGRHAGVSLSVETQESPLLEEWLTAQRYDLGLTEHDSAPAGTRLELLVQVDEVCVLPDGHPLLARTAVALADFAGQAFVSLSASDPYRVQIDEAFAQAGVLPRSIVETPTAVSVCTFVRQGLGLAIVNPLTALDFVGRGLHIRPLTLSFPFRVNVVFPEHRPGNPLVGAFMDSLRDAAAAIKGRLAAAESA